MDREPRNKESLIEEIAFDLYAAGPWGDLHEVHSNMRECVFSHDMKIYRAMASRMLDLVEGHTFIWHRLQCERCGHISTNKFGGGGKCPVFPHDAGLRDHHEMRPVRLEVRVLNDVIRPEFREASSVA